MAYNVKLSKNVIKTLIKINEPNYSNLKSAIYSLSDNPRPMGYKKLKGRNGFRIRVGNYRIIYSIMDEELIVEIIAIGHRKDIYD